MQLGRFDANSGSSRPGKGLRRRASVEPLQPGNRARPHYRHNRPQRGGQDNPVQRGVGSHTPHCRQHRLRGPAHRTQRNARDIQPGVGADLSNPPGDAADDRHGKPYARPGPADGRKTLGVLAPARKGGARGAPHRIPGTGRAGNADPFPPRRRIRGQSLRRSEKAAGAWAAP